MREQVAAEFAAAFGRPPELIARSPGRVNLIGDHTDYNDGFVLPVAIDHATWLAAAPRTDRTVVVASHEYGRAEIDLDVLVPTGSWVDYVAGTLHELATPLATGFELAIATDVPVGAGLSSSAALELGVARIGAELCGETWLPIVAARAAQRAENDFVGMPCGIMDQLIVAAGVAGHALLIDCRSLETKPAPIPGSATVVILDTGTRRRLVDSAYEERRRACEHAAAALDVAALRDAKMEMVQSPPLDAVALRRARHVVSENARVLDTVESLVAGNLEETGRLMDESHASLRDDFEVSSPALDAITEIARSHPACFGARVTGGGFAGCAVAVVASDGVDDFTAATAAAYDAATGNTSTLYPTSAAAGVSLA